MQKYFHGKIFIKTKFHYSKNAKKNKKLSTHFFVRFHKNHITITMAAQGREIYEKHPSMKLSSLANNTKRAFIIYQLAILQRFPILKKPPSNQQNWYNHINHINHIKHSCKENSSHHFQNIPLSSLKLTLKLGHTHNHQNVGTTTFSSRLSERVVSFANALREQNQELGEGASLFI